MNIEEADKLKRELENKILLLIMAFEGKSGTTVQSVDLMHLQTVSARFTATVSLTVEL